MTWFRQTRTLSALTLAAGALTAACGGGGSSVAASSSTAGLPAAAVQEAEQIFVSRCVTCHGERGGGDGPGSASLDPKPRNFGDPSWQASVDDAHIEKIIKFGGTAVGKSPAMVGNPDLTAKDDVVRALRAHVRSLSR